MFSLKRGIKNSEIFETLMKEHEKILEVVEVLEKESLKKKIKESFF